jgi:hypothetical protein
LKGIVYRKNQVHWIRTDLALIDGDEMEVMARVRYRQPLQGLLYINLKTGVCFFISRTTISNNGRAICGLVSEEKLVRVIS